ncbi:hypothetical protein DV737_g3901, partial [Chaetothyriales sp. CBS 132003]
MKSTLGHSPQGEESPGFEDESSTAASRPDGSPAAPVTASTTCTTSNTTKSAQVVPSALRAGHKTVSVSSPQAAGLQEKIRQLQSSIEHTKSQLCDTLDKISASDQNRQQPTSSPAKPSALATYPLSDLSPDQQQSLVRAQAILDHHIKQLGKYNQLKDIAMEMLGMVAEREGKTMREMMAAREIEDDD